MSICVGTERRIAVHLVLQTYLLLRCQDNRLKLQSPVHELLYGPPGNRVGNCLGRQIEQLAHISLDK